MQVTPKTARRTVIDVDRRGRVSVGKLGFKDVQLVAEELGEGIYTIQPAVVLTEVEAAHYRNPDAVDTLKQARVDLAEGRVSSFKPRTKK